MVKTNKFEQLILLGMVLSLVAIGYSGIRWYKLSHYAEWYTAVAVGDSRTSVIQKMGRPDGGNIKPHWLWSDESKASSEFLYGHSFPPEWWFIGFDRDDRVVCKAELLSP